MQDVLLKLDNETGFYDLVVEDNATDFSSVAGLESAIIVSLFTDTRATRSEVQDPAGRRGWIGDLLALNEGQPIGSLLWLLEQARITQETLNFAQAYARGAFNWMIERGILGAINVSVEQRTSRSILIELDFVNNEGVVSRYQVLWDLTEAQNFIGR